MDERGISYEGTPPVAATGEHRVALVIGNAGYKHGKPLPNPHNNAKAIADMFARLEFELHQHRTGLTTHWHQDLGLLEMRRVFADFAIKVETADMAVLYFSGHGLEIDGENNLLPVDPDLKHVRADRRYWMTTN
ncbi:hypothetical protein MnTg02_01661 [bacterium MnTg02]|nr:hypothetical protein MnTg02_01661 [bacterium MnTg02]